MEKERLKFAIGRFDHYYDSVNNKGNIVLGLSTFMVGGIATSYSIIISNTNDSFWLKTSIISLVILGLMSMLTMIIASVPYLTPESNSMFYFGSISKMSKSNFKTCSSSLTDEQEVEDLREQVYLLAKGLKGKFLKLRIATIILAFQIVLLIPTFFLIIINLK